MSKNSGPVALNSNEATITTATITIKALKVNNRQLTQAVFRQLPERKLIDESKPELIGLPWGWVNYHSADMGEGRQFVAQFGTSLARCPIRLMCSPEFFQSPYSGPKGYYGLFLTYQEIAANATLAAALDGTLSADAVKYDKVKFSARGGIRSIVMKFDEFVDNQDTDMIRQAVDPNPSYRYTLGPIREYMEIPREEVIETGRQRLRKALEERGADPATPVSRHLAELARVADLASAYCRRWDDLINTLESVEQLFIAT